MKIQNFVLNFDFDRIVLQNYEIHPWYHFKTHEFQTQSNIVHHTNLKEEEKKFPFSFFMFHVYASASARASRVLRKTNTHITPAYSHIHTVFIYGWMTYSFVNVLRLSYNSSQTNWNVNLLLTTTAKKIETHTYLL